jgi:hypothetical protein
MSAKELHDLLYIVADDQTQFTQENDDAWATLDAAFAELEQLRAWQARAMPIVEAMSTRDAILFDDEDGYYYCDSCHSTTHDLPDTLEHFEDCKAKLARALLAEKSPA